MTFDEYEQSYEYNPTWAYAAIALVFFLDSTYNPIMWFVLVVAVRVVSKLERHLRKPV